MSFVKLVIAEGAQQNGATESISKLHVWYGTVWTHKNVNILLIYLALPHPFRAHETFHQEPKNYASWKYLSLCSHMSRLVAKCAQMVMFSQVSVIQPKGGVPACLTKAKHHDSGQSSGGTHATGLH